MANNFLSIINHYGRRSNVPANAEKTRAAQNTYVETSNLIRKGLATPCASTGTPISDLHGAARMTAIMSNIGGGSKATNGGGIEAGLKAIALNTAARGYLERERAEAANNDLRSRRYRIG